MIDGYFQEHGVPYFKVVSKATGNRRKSAPGKEHFVSNFVDCLLIVFLEPLGRVTLFNS